MRKSPVIGGGPEPPEPLLDMQPIARPRVGQLEAVPFRSSIGYDILPGITASAFFSRSIMRHPGSAYTYEDRS